MIANAPDILAVGLNPVRQTTLIFQSFHPGQVNRATSRRLAAGGKGAHAAVAANTIRPGSCAVAQFIGGAAGSYVTDELLRQGIPQWTIPIHGETRGCITLLDESTATMTELVEPSPHIEPEAVTALLKRLKAEIPKLKAISLCGTFPSGCGKDPYADIAQETRGKWLVLDAVQDISETLNTGFVDVLKINAHELLSLTVQNSVESAANDCRHQFGIPWIAVTDGPADAWLFGPDDAWTFSLPRLERVINPLGAGDTVTGVMMRRLADGMGVQDAFADGLAAATASCKHHAAAIFTEDDMQQCRKKIVITRSYPG